MDPKNVLKDKIILVVDDEPDILQTVDEMLDVSLLHKVGDYDTALQYLLSYTYDIVLLDIMGVNGFELLKASVLRGFPTVMFTAHALNPEALKKSMRLGAVFFLPKEKISELKAFLEDVVLERGKPIWKMLFDRFGDYFDKRFGPDWKQKDKFFKEFELSLKESD